MVIIITITLSDFCISHAIHLNHHHHNYLPSVIPTRAGSIFQIDKMPSYPIKSASGTCLHFDGDGYTVDLLVATKKLTHWLVAWVWCRFGLCSAQHCPGRRAGSSSITRRNRPYRHAIYLNIFNYTYYYSHLWIMILDKLRFHYEVGSSAPPRFRRVYW